MEKLQNNDRQRRLRADTERLVDRVNDLKKQVDGDSTLSPADLGRRAEEIEKLAKSVKDRMKG